MMLTIADQKVKFGGNVGRDYVFIIRTQTAIEKAHLGAKTNMLKKGLLASML